VLTAENQQGQVYELAGDGSFTLGELAAEIAHQSGKPIDHVNLKEVAYKELLEKVGLPAPLADMLANSESGAAKGALFDDSRQLSRLIGRPTTPWQTTITAAI
jgi:NAD(P)H dehydrogenase (quinone)